ncbi:hypothetical protein Sme01_36230 [Sphaerisporangium melleum]|uniref:S-adenosyl methyltransferase n=1 Tax=Sphaerisporangium melleum TaxID=321316 RepID=A0A917RQK8_9ACTN|nr:SAM-dependent methyltransferase [Sphaerisporangium melleum]GGL19117.1 hypothetical protein GCM10007964_71410 [Sphaerisporangium melleum]GII71147.1 hypothetical protein Sme01_36230 [Sphaerisporangium melleum]
MDAPERDPVAGVQAAVLRQLDLSTPSVARMYDYYLGGKDNFEVDRECADEVLRRAPLVPVVAQANRDFLRRAVRYLARECGIRQFLDIGTGLPTQDNVHQVAQRVDPRVRVVYVDNDPLVLIHAQALLANNPNTLALAGDLRQPWRILDDPHVRGVIDFREPVAVLLCGILHFIPDHDDPYGIVATLVHAMAPGSYLVVSHAERHRDLTPATGAYDRASSPVVLRSLVEIAGFLNGLEWVEPGVVYLPLWRPDRPMPTDRLRVPAYGGVGRKP